MQTERGARTYSSRTKLPTDIPPQLFPIRLPARLSLRWRLAWSRLGLFMEMGFAPALTKESLRARPAAESRKGPVVISTVSGGFPPVRSSGGLTRELSSRVAKMALRWRGDKCVAALKLSRLRYRPVREMFGGYRRESSKIARGTRRVQVGDDVNNGRMALWNRKHA